MLNQVALDAADGGQAVVGEGSDLGPTQTVAEAAVLLGDLAVDPKHRADGAGGDARLNGQVIEVVDSGHERGSHDDTPQKGGLRYRAAIGMLIVA